VEGEEGGRGRDLGLYSNEVWYLCTTYTHIAHVFTHTHMPYTYTTHICAHTHTHTHTHTTHTCVHMPYTYTTHRALFRSVRNYVH